MQQTPLHHVPNMDLLNVMPKASRVVEAGASSGALAQAYKQQHPECCYIGIEIDPVENQKSIESDRDIATPSSQARVFVIHTQEEWQIAQSCWLYMNGKCE